MAMITLPLLKSARIKTPHNRHTNVCVRWTSGPEAPVNDLMFVSMNQNVLAMATANTGAEFGAFGVRLNQNYSGGELTLASADPTHQPHVHQRMLSDERDLSRLRHGVRTLAEMVSSETTTSIIDGSGERRNQTLFAGPGNDSELDDYLLANVGDAQHATSTCRMGASGTAETVVDPVCRVLGVDGLHVIDASIFASVPRANTNLAAIMVGELMADRLA